MARPVDHEKRKEIVQRAFEVVLERGVAKTTMSHIAQALGMKRPTLYWYFSDVDKLFEAVAEGLEGRMLERTVAAMAAHDHPIDQLIAMLREVTAFYEEERTVVEGLVRLWSARPEASEMLAGRDRRQREFLTSLVEQGIEAGRVRPCDAAGLVHTVFALVDGAVLRTVLVGVSPASMLEFAERNLLAPLRLPAGEAGPAGPADGAKEPGDR